MIKISRCMYNSNESVRIGYIDAMRGLAIILVLQSHVANRCFNINYDTPSLHFLPWIQLPLFFFISGFLSKKIVSFKKLIFFLYEKASTYLFSAIVFMICYAYISHQDVIDGFYNDAKYGYWFTFSLFQFLLIYSVFSYMFASLEIKSWKQDLVFFVLSVLMYLMSIPTIQGYTKLYNDSFYNLVGMGYWKYFLYYSIGVIIHKYYGKVVILLKSTYFLLALVTSFFILIIFESFFRTNCWTLYCLVLPVTGLFLCFSFFYRYEVLFSESTYVGRLFCVIGKRTLDIYYIHYFLIPSNVSIMTTVFHDYPMPIVEYFITSICVALIIGICMLVGCIIRLSPHLAYYLLGAKMR